jgi:hypothetical protein
MSSWTLRRRLPRSFGASTDHFAERGVRGGDRALDLGSGAVRDLGDDGAVGGVLDVEGGARVGVHPFAVDVHALEVGHG